MLQLKSKKALAILLSITMLIVTISVSFGLISSADTPIPGVEQSNDSTLPDLPDDGYQGNVLEKATLKAAAVKGTNKDAIDVSETSEALIDQDVDTSLVMSSQGFTDATLGNAPGSTDNYYELVYDLRGSAKLLQLCVVLNNNIANRAASYAVSAAKTEAELFTATGNVYNFNNTSGVLKQTFDYTDLEASFVSIRIYNVGASDGKAYLAELLLFAEEYFFVPYSYDATLFKTTRVTSSPIDQTNFDAIPGTNLLFEKLPFQVSNTGTPVAVNKLAAVSENIPMLTDGKMNMHVDTMVDMDISYENYCDIVFQIDPTTAYEIDTVYFRGAIGDDLRKRYIGRYDIYAADTIGNLFSEENRIYSYDYEKQDDLYGGVVINFNDEVIANYVALRTYTPGSTQGTKDTARISEFAVFGKVAVITPKPINLAKNMPMTAYIEEAGKYNQVSTEDFTFDEVKKISDGKKITSADITNNGKPVHLLYNLCQEASIDRVVLTASEDANVLKNVKVYASNSINDIWKESSLVYTQPAGTLASVNGAFASTINARYVRVVVNSDAANLSLSEVVVEGMDYIQGRGYQTLSYQAFNKSPSGIKQVSLYKYILSSKRFQAYRDNDKFRNSGVTNISRLLDGDYKASADFDAAILGRETDNIVIYLEDLRSVDEITINFSNKLDRLYPKKLNVYCGEVLDDVLTAEAKPVKTFATPVYDTKTKSTKLTLQMTPTLMRYVRIEFVENDPEADYINGNHMTFAVTELDIKGTSVTGFQKDPNNPALVTFSDAATGIKWEIQKLDNNDIINSVVRSELKVSTANAAQKASLYKAPYYKIAGDKIYEIVFYDANGNQVTDIQDRNIKIYFPVNADQLNYKTMVADASSAEAIVAAETTIADGYISSVANFEDCNKFAFLEITDGNDSYWNSVK